jgi:arylsulfate sulfotransferase
MKKHWIFGLLGLVGLWTASQWQAGAQQTCNTAFRKVTANASNKARGYPDPTLSVTCSNSSMVVTSNNIPDFEFVQTTPSRLREQNVRLEITLSPKIATQTTAVPLGGASAVTTTGLLIFGPTEAPRDGYKDPYLDGLLDYCNGHTAQMGDYHFHNLPKCYSYSKTPGAVLGYTLDGFPIVAGYVCTDSSCSSTQALKSSWRVKAGRTGRDGNAWEVHEYVAGLGDLDQCNGKKDAQGNYAYYATETFPYFMGCYVGTPNLSRPTR